MVVSIERSIGRRQSPLSFFYFIFERRNPGRGHGARGPDLVLTALPLVPLSGTEITAEWILQQIQHPRKPLSLLLKSHASRRSTGIPIPPAFLFLTAFLALG